MRRNRHYYRYREYRYYKKPYTLWSFLFDLLLVCVTGGFWLIWIFVREMRNR